MRRRYREFVGSHEVAWELAMAGLAVAYVAVGFAGEDANTATWAWMPAVEGLLTGVFLAEFVTRLVAAESRLRYLQAHAIDLVALLPLARGLRVARLVRLLRLVRTFSGVRRAFLRIEQLGDHHGLGSVAIAWLGTMFVCSTVFYEAEAGANPLVQSPGDALWWGIATITGGTIDIRPYTDEGRLANAILLLVGMALFAGMTSLLVSFLVQLGRDSDKSAEARRELRWLETLRDDGAIDEAYFVTRRAQLASDSR
jgi:hypothetical protein